MWSKGELKVGDNFCTKEDCVRAIIHMENSVDYTIDCTDARRYVIVCHNVLCMFRLVAYYRKISDSWEISSIHLPHSFTTINISHDHRKLNSKLICQYIFPLVSKDPSVNMSKIISHIVTQYDSNPSYKKVWIVRTKPVGCVYGNWEDSYKELQQCLVALKTYASRTVTILETFLAYSQDKTCVDGNRIFHQLFWAFQPCIKGFVFCKPILQIDGTWL